MKTAIFWDVTPFSMVEDYRRFGGTYCFHFQVSKSNIKQATNTNNDTSTAVVRHLGNPINNACRNVTTEGSPPTVRLICTLHTDKKHIAEELKELTGRDLYCRKSAFAYRHSVKPPVTVVSYTLHDTPLVRCNKSFTKFKENFNRFYLI
jgi:hypothetical protein